MASNKSITYTEGRYTQGGSSVQTNTLGWWERRIIPYADDDTFIEISGRYNRRPDIVAYDFYQKAIYQWVILQYNNIVDINTEFVTGATIRLPSRSRLFREILARTV